MALKVEARSSWYNYRRDAHLYIIIGLKVLSRKIVAFFSLTKITTHIHKYFANEAHIEDLGT